MNNKYILELIISNPDDEKLFSIKNALEPDTYNVPKDCRVFIEMKQKLYLYIECSEINDLRALFNSYYSILSSILHIVEEISS